MKKLQAAIFAAACGVAVPASAQGPLSQPGFVAGGPAAVQDVAPALHHAPGGSSPFVNAHGDPFVSPAQYCQSCPPGGGYGGYPGGGGLDPFGGAVFNTPQSGPHYFDFAAEYLRYQRETDSSGDQLISSFGFPTPAAPDPVPALSTGDVNDGDLNGYRLTGRMDLGALSVVEFSYAALYGEESATAQVNAGDANRLFTVFSGFGTRTNGPSDLSTPGAPRNLTGSGAPGDLNANDNNPGGTNFRQTDFATLHELTIDQDLQTAEASYRRYWVGANPRVSGTYLIGFRYTQLSEDASLFSLPTAYNELLFAAPAGPFAADPSQAITISAESSNSLAGLQVGGDAWVTVTPGFRVGGEGKVGIYGNDYKARGLGFVLDDSQVAFLTECKLSFVADVTPSMSIRGGYELLYITDLVLASGALANSQPFGDVTGGFAVPVDTSVDALFHGFHVGAEYVW